MAYSESADILCCAHHSKSTTVHPFLRLHLQNSRLPALTTDPPNSPHPALGIDHGDARIGIAATDDFGILAHPVETIDRAKADPIDRIARIVEMRKIRTLVVGLPVRMDGSEGDSAAKVRAFAELLRERIPTVPLIFVDESLTTANAAAKLREAGRKARDQKSVIDQAAAVEILNTWMEEGGYC
jgi:putative Holliday junction resolvase